MTTKQLNVGEVGNVRRELIFSEDIAEGIVQTLEKYEDYQLPLNLGFNSDITIRDLAEKIAKLVDFSGDIKWDQTRPDGQSRKLLNSIRWKLSDIELNQTSLDDGLRKTIEWYKENKNDKSET
jgi:nucleoside-diphosphate-sugar epimerase